MGVSDQLAESGFVPAYGLVKAKFVTHQRSPGGETDGAPVQGRVLDMFPHTDHYEVMVLLQRQ